MTKTNIVLLFSLSALISCRREVTINPSQKTTEAALFTALASPRNINAGQVPVYAVEVAQVATIFHGGVVNPTGGIAVDAAGNIYIADQPGNVIRKVTRGTPTVFAGDGHSGFKDGLGTTAEFAGPSGLAFDTQGNLYVADKNNNRIRMITPDGTVSTFAGTGVAGKTNGSATTAQFCLPTGVAADTLGNLYVADFGNNMVRKITNKFVSTLAGDGRPGNKNGVATLAEFNGPIGVAVAPNGFVYVADMFNQRIRRIFSQFVLDLAGSGNPALADGNGAAASFNFPTGVAVDAAGNIYITDSRNNRIRKSDFSGTVITLAGNDTTGTADGAGSFARFNRPWGIAINQAGTILVGDSLSGGLRELGVEPAVLTLAGNGSTIYQEGKGKNAGISHPYSITIDSTGLLTFEDIDRRFRRCTPDGTTSFLAGNPSKSIGDGPGDSAGFCCQTGIISDAAQNIYVADGNNNRIRKIAPDGTTSTFATDTSGFATNPFNTVSSLNFDAAGNIIFTNFFKGTVRKLTPAGAISILDSLPQRPGSAFFASTTDVAGNIYVSDAGTSTIYKVTPDGTQSVFFTGQPPAVINTGTKSFAPRGLAADARGNIYVADFNNNRIVIFSPAGQVVKQLGNIAGFFDGGEIAVSFNQPTWVTINRKTGIVYIADQGNNRIRMMNQLF